jgi:dihydrofolate synthase/folylpolyglutamate synthase
MAVILTLNGRVISAPQPDEAMQVISEVAARQNARVTVIGREVYVGTGHLPEVISDDAGVPIYQSFTVSFEDEWGAPAGKLRIKLPLLGNHQQVNAAVALAALQVLKEKGANMTGDAILKGMLNVQWPGRLEVVRKDPVVVVDGAHNVESIAKLGQAVADLFPKQKVVVVLGISREKDIDGILGEMRVWADGISGPTVERLIITRSRHPRAANPRDVVHAALALGLTVELRDDVRSALSRAETSVRQLARADEPEPLVLVTGSLFVVAEARDAYGLAPNLDDET